MTMNQSQADMCPLPAGPLLSLPPHPIPPGYHRAPALGSLFIHPTPTGYLFYTQ